MKYKRKKMWKSWILFGFIFAMFFLIPTGYAYLKTRDVKTEKDIITDEMKLKNIGYSLNDISIIIKNKNIKKYALKNETFKNIINTKSYQINNLTVYSSLHKTGDYYNIDTSFITGGKTGYTLEAGRCLASIATDTENNINYLLVTTNASNTPDHILDAHDIYKYYFQNYKYHTILKKGTDLVDIKVIDSDIKNIKFKAKKDITKYLDNTFNINNVKIKYDGLDILSYKNKKGEKVGTIKLIYNNDVIDKLDIILDTEIKFNLFVYIFANSLRRTIFFGFVLLIIFIVIIKRKKTTN